VRTLHIDFHGLAHGNLSSEHGEREGVAPVPSPREGATRAPVIAGASDRSTIMVGEPLERLNAHCDATKRVIVTDRRVRALHGALFPPWEVIEIGRGERSKTLATVNRLYEAFLQHEVDRSSLVVAVGGGLVCDVAGYAASTYLRGLRFGFVPTTLLAQVDASVGGKNGVNFKGYKNLVGTFTQPRFVLCDFSLLRTLPAPELKNGFAEAIKTAAVSDAQLFSFLEATWKGALSLEPGPIERIIYDCLALKSRIVSLDEKEKGERRKLNFGHTVGHALEKVNHLRHGEAVSLGMVAAAKLSTRRGLLSRNDAGRIEDLLRKFDLPVKTHADAGPVREALRKDKKRENEEIHFVLLDGIGNARVEPVEIHELDEVLHDLR
jgi:3-dehydroquinate synthase